jgi:hypothetical protein
VGDLSFRVRGPYFESCNCEAICPCRMVDGVRGGRSTYGVCFGVLSWRIEKGRVGETDVSGLAVVMAFEYSDDEPGSPWSLVLHVDAAGSAEQREALRRVFLEGLTHLPWISKARKLIDVRASPIELGHGLVRIGEAVSVRAGPRVETESAVACGIPGYDRPGHEHYAEELAVEDEPFSWALSGNCAYVSDFDYSGRL